MIAMNELRGRARITTSSGERFDDKIIGVSHLDGTDFLQLEEHGTVSLKKLAVISSSGKGPVLIGPATTLDGLREATREEIYSMLEQHRESGPLLPTLVLVGYDGFNDYEGEDPELVDESGEPDSEDVSNADFALIEVPDDTSVVVLEESGRGGFIEVPAEGVDEPSDAEAPVESLEENIGGESQADVTGTEEDDFLTEAGLEALDAEEEDEVSQ